MWTEAQENAFQHLKFKQNNRPILQYQDFFKGVQPKPVIRDWVPCCHKGKSDATCRWLMPSRCLNTAENHYTTSEKELLAIVSTTKYFRPYLYGQRFRILSDHKPLVWVMNIKDPGSRLLRWRIQLAEYDNEITYRRGSQNTNADALSRIGSVSKEGDLSDEFDEDRKKKI